MPIYDVRCRVCGSTFEVNRPMAEADDPAPCPAGHDDTMRLLPAVAVTGRVGAAPRPGGGGGGGAGGGACCGGGGCCG